MRLVYFYICSCGFLCCFEVHWIAPLLLDGVSLDPGRLRLRLLQHRRPPHPRRHPLTSEAARSMNLHSLTITLFPRARGLSLYFPSLIFSASSLCVNFPMKVLTRVECPFPPPRPRRWRDQMCTVLRGVNRGGGMAFHLPLFVLGIPCCLAYI